MNARKTAMKWVVVVGVVGVIAMTADRALADRPDHGRGQSYDRRDGGHDRDGFRDRDRDDRRDRDGRWDRDGGRRPVVVPIYTYPRVFAPAPVYVRPIAPCNDDFSFSVRAGGTIIRINIGG